MLSFPLFSCLLDFKYSLLMVINACGHLLSKLILTKGVGMFSCFGETEPVYVPQLPMTASTRPLTYHILLPLHSVSYQGIAYVAGIWPFRG